MDRSQNQYVPTKHVRFVFSSVICLITKVRTITDLSTIEDSQRIMRVKAKSASEETVQTLAKVKEEIFGNTIKVKKSTAVGEETKALARKDAEVGKTAVSIMREVKKEA